MPLLTSAPTDTGSPSTERVWLHLRRAPTPVTIDGEQYDVYLLCDDQGVLYRASHEELLYLANTEQYDRLIDKLGTETSTTIEEAEVGYSLRLRLLVPQVLNNAPDVIEV